MSARSANRALVIKLVVVAIGMFGFGFALAPIYSKLCELTGVNNLQTRDAGALNTQVDRSRTITVQFDANLRNELPWTFRPLTKSMQVHPGELVHVVYEVKNASDRGAFGQAIPFDENGNHLGNSLMDYFLPTAVETPHWETDHTVTPSPHHPIGAKGVAESPHVGGIPCFSNAVIDAFSHLGVTHMDMPHNAFRVWQQLKELGLNKR